MKKIKRTVNKNLLNALIAYRGLNLVSLGRLCNPPVTNAALSMFFAGKNGSNKLSGQIVEILRPVAADLTFEAENLYDQDLLDALFPCVKHESVAPAITEGNHNTLPEKKGES